MEVLVYRYGSICEPDILSCFQKMGLNVVTEETELTNKKILPSERVKNLSHLFDTHTFTFVFSINFYPSISDICEIYRIPYVCWSVDCPVMELFQKSVQNTCNRIFCFDRAQYEAIAPCNTAGIFYLPLATNVDRWDRVISAISAADRAKYAADISFVGSLYTEKNPYMTKDNKGVTFKEKLPDDVQGFIDGLCAAQEQLYGFNLLQQTLTETVITALKQEMAPLFYEESTTIYNTDAYVAANQIVGMHVSCLERIHLLQALGRQFDVDLYTFSDLSEFKGIGGIHHKGGAKTLTEMPKIFHLSKINLNITMRPIQTGLSLRIWDVLGCGGFLMCNYQPELFEYFTPGVELETFASCDELIDKCAYYLTHDSERQSIARAGYEKVKAMHTYDHRIADMIRTVYGTMQ